MRCDYNTGYELDSLDSRILKNDLAKLEHNHRLNENKVG